MRKINLIWAMLFFCLGPSLLSAGEKLRIGDFPTEGEKKEDLRLKKKGLYEPPEPKKQKPAPRPSQVINRTRYIPVTTSTVQDPQKKVTTSGHSNVKSSSSKIPSTDKPKVKIPSEESKKQSAALYLKALDASQHGKLDEAADLCAQALKLDPSNLQAERMNERLESRRKQR